jgi:hypothetical protein
MKKISLSILLMVITITSFGQDKFYNSYEIVQDSVFNDDFFNYFETGITSKKDGQILIPKSYRNIAVENEYLICKKVDTIDYKTTYDIYNWSKTEITPFKLNIVSYKDFPLEIFHTANKKDFKLRHCLDSTYYTLTTHTGMGLYFLDLFDYSYRHTEVFDATHDFVAPIGINKNKVAGVKNGEIIIKQLSKYKRTFTSYPFSAKKSIYFNMDYELGYDEDAAFYVDGTSHYPQNDSESGEVYYNAYEKPAKDLSVNFNGLHGIEVINESLIYVQGFFIEPENPIFDDDGYELVDDFGDIIYFQPPGEFTSGMYNLKKQEWVVNRNKSFILKTYLGFLEETATYSEEEKDPIFSYSFKNNDGSYKFEDISIEALMALEDANQYITPKYKVDSITPFMNVNKLWSDGQPHFCAKNDNGIYYLLPNQKEYEASNLPFINEVSLRYAIEKEAIQFYTDDTLVSFPLSGDVLLFELSEMSDGYFNKLYLQTNNQFFDISDFSFKQVKSLGMDVIDSLLKKHNNVIMHSDGGSMLTFHNSYTYEIHDEYGEELGADVRAYSGVYNYKTKIWIAEPKYRAVLQLEDDYLLWFPEKIEVKYQNEWDSPNEVTTLAEEYFTIIDAQGRRIETAKKVMELPISYLNKIDKKELALLQLNDFERMQIQYELVSYIEDEDLGGDGVFYGKSKDNKWGLYQTYSRGEIIPAKYDSIARLGWDSPFTIVWNNAKAGIYKDVFGEPSESISCIYEDAKRGYSNGRYYLAAQKDGKWGYVDWYNGKELTEFIYDSIEELPWPDDYPSEYYN